VAFPAGCRRIRFPPLFMTTLWPFVAIDPRNAATILPAQAEGAYPHFLANRLILQLMDEGHPPEVVLERFLALRIAEFVDLDRLHTLSMSKIRKLDRDSDVQMAETIDGGFTAERLFVMQLHPTGAMFAHLLRALLGALAVPCEGPTARLVEAIARWPGIGNYDAPVHPQIAEHFGLAWARGLTYRYFEEGFFDFETCVRRYIAFEHIREFSFAAELERRGDVVHAEAALRRAVELHPKVARLHLRLGLLLERQGRAAEAARALSQAVWLRRDIPAFHRHLARVLHGAGMLPMAYASAAIAVALDGDRLEAVVGLADILDALGRTDEAADARRQADALRACFGDPTLDLETVI
jgi:tetratricopeptide (TPR) repeat protein